MYALIGQAVYQLFLRLRTAPGRIAFRIRDFCNRVRYFLIRKSDPVIRMRCNGEPLYMHLSHQLPLYQAVHPLYDRALPRIAKKIADADGEVVMIDVGANIGDTAVSVLSTAAGRCLCVEGDDRYFPLLVRNTARFGSRVTNVYALCTSANSPESVTALRGGGTTRFTETKEESNSLPVLTLDEIVARHPRAARTNLLKIDTDGFDFKVLRGAQHLLASAKPTLFFELQPSFLEAQGENPMSIFPWLNGCGYDRVLLYDNAGNPAVSCRAIDQDLIVAALGRIDGKQIHYYDVLTIHNEAPQLVAAMFASEAQHAIP